MKRFVVRDGVGCKPSFSFEHFTFDAEREKHAPYSGKIIYQAEVPETMDLSEAISLYKQGVRVKPPKIEEKKLPPLEQIMREKKERRERAFRELTHKVA